MSARPTTPPTTPPAIAPVWLLDPVVWTGGLAEFEAPAAVAGALGDAITIVEGAAGDEASVDVPENVNDGAVRVCDAAGAVTVCTEVWVAT